MTADILLTLAIVAGALGLFTWNRLRVDVAGIIVMAALIVTGLLTPAEVVGRTLGEAQFASTCGLEAIGLERDGQRRYSVDASAVVRAGDLLLVRGKVTDVARMEEELHLRIRQPATAFVPDVAAEAEDDDPDRRRLAELMVTPSSQLVGRTLEETNFRHRFGVPVSGVRRTARRAGTGSATSGSSLETSFWCGRPEGSSWTSTEGRTS